MSTEKKKRAVSPKKKAPLSKKKAEKLFWEALADDKAFDAELLDQSLSSGHIAPDLKWDYLGMGEELYYTPLEYVIMYPGEESYRCCEVLLKHGADAKRKKYGTLLQIACIFGHVPTLELLFAHGAEVEEEFRPSSYRGGSELFNVLQSGSLEALLFIINRGHIELPAKDSSDMFSLFSVAASRGNPALLDHFLHELGVPIELRCSHTGRTILLDAAYWGNREQVEFLKERGADASPANLDRYGHNADFYLAIIDRFTQALTDAGIESALSENELREVRYLIREDFSMALIMVHATGENCAAAIQRAFDQTGIRKVARLLAVCEGFSLLHGFGKDEIKKLMKDKYGEKVSKKVLVIEKELDWDCDMARVLLVIDPTKREAKAKEKQRQNSRGVLQFPSNLPLDEEDEE